MFFDKVNREDLARVVEKFNIRMILLFGSAVARTRHARSDIDIAVSCEKPNLLLERFSELVFELQTLFPQGEVDIAIINLADPLFLKKILERCELLYGEESDLARLRIYAFKRYVDHKDFFRMEEEFACKFVARCGGKASR